MDTQQIIDQFENLRCTAKHPVFYLTGQAGTGKTYTIKQAIEQQPNFAQLAASTGIAGVNLGTTTINQVLKYFNTDSLQDAYQAGQLTMNLRKVRKFNKFLVIDEASMIPYQQLDIFCWALDEINNDVEDDERLGLILVGDFAQLPPVPGNLIVAGKPVLTKDGQRNVKEPTPWAFKSELWSRFEEEGHLIKLEKIYRQSDPTFLNGINAIRKGLGKSGVSYLSAAGVEFTRELDNHFDGTTIVGKNEEVDRINKIRLNQLDGKTQLLPSSRWWAGQVLGWKQPSEWQYIPEQLELKVGAYVMVLSNMKDPLTGWMEAVNGDCGWVREITQLRVPVYGAPDPESDDPTAPPTIISEEIQWVVRVELVRRPGELVTIPVIKRMIESRHDVDDVLKTHEKFPKDDITKQPKKIRNSMGRAVWCLGEIEYFPLRLAYATTTHKCVAPDTWVLTKERGLCKISEVNPDQRVFTGNSMEEVTEKVNTMQRAYRIVTDSGFELICGENHPILTENQGFLDASALTTSDKVKIASFGMQHFREWDTNVPSSLTPDVAWMLGVMVGDGSYNEKAEGQLHITTADPFMQQRLLEIFEKLGRKISIRSDGRGLHSTQKEFRSWLYGLGLDYVLATNKTIPWSMTTHKTLLRHFLQGLFDTDGSVGRSYVVFCTASKIMSQQVQIGLEALGIPTKRSEYPGTKDPYYQIRVGAEGLDMFKECVGFSRPYKAEALAALQPNRIIRKRGEWDAVKEVVDLGIEIPMVDISVAAEHVFVANGIVTHNSQGLSLDRIQIDPRGHFMGQPAMAYVALSRGRTPEGIKIVGSSNLFAERVKIDEAVRRFI